MDDILQILLITICVLVVAAVLFFLIRDLVNKSEATRDWLTEEEAEAFTGENGAFYLDKWKDRPKSFFKGWNWAAAFFLVEWLAYRKMYLLSIFLLPGPWIGFPGRGVPIAIFIFAGLNHFLDFWPAIIISILIARFLGGGLLGNIFYREVAVAALKKSLHMSESERIAYLREKGGTNPIAPVIAVAVQAAIIIAIVVCVKSSQ